MKKVLAIAILLLFIPMTAYAHSGLSSSTPAEGESLDASPADIRFEFDTPIQQGEMILTDESGIPVELSDVSVSEMELIGVLDGELPNGAYTVDWNVISQDSHEVTGTLIFNVGAEETSTEETATEEETSEETPETSESADEATSPAEDQADQAAASADESSQGSSMWVTIIIVAILAIAAITFFVLARRK